MQEPIFLKPVFHEKIWGGTGLRDEFGYDIPSDHTGVGHFSSPTWPSRSN